MLSEQNLSAIFFVKRLLQGVHSQPLYPSKPNSLGASSTLSTWRTGGPWAADLETHRVRRVGSSPRACTDDRAQGAVSLPQFPRLKPGSVANTPTSRPSTEARWQMFCHLLEILHSEHAYDVKLTFTDLCILQHFLRKEKIYFCCFMPTQCNLD